MKPKTELIPNDPFCRSRNTDKRQVSFYDLSSERKGSGNDREVQAATRNQCDRGGVWEKETIKAHKEKNTVRT